MGGRTTGGSLVGWLLARARLQGLEREAWILFVLRTMNSTAFSASMPFFGIYLLTVRSVSMTVIGLVYFATGLLGMGGQVIGGRLEDALGPKKVMVLAYVSALSSGLVLGYLALVNAEVSVFFLVYPAFSLLRMLSNPATASIIAGHQRSQVRPGLNLLTIGGNLGFAIGPAIGGPLASAYGYADVFFFSSVAVVPVIIMTALLVKGGIRYAKEGSVALPPKRTLSWKDDGSVIWFLVLTFCLYVSIGYEITPISLYVADFLKFSPSEIGYLFATNGLVIVILQLPLVNLAERSKNLVLPLVASGAVAVASFLIAGSSSDFLRFEAVMVVITVGEILLTVPSQTIISLFSKAGNRGTYQGYYYAASNGGRSVAAFVGPLIFDLLTPSQALGWYLIAGFTLAVSAGFGILGPGLQRAYRVVAQDET